MRRMFPLCLAALFAACASAPLPKPAADVRVEVLKLDVKSQTLTDFVAVATIQISNPSDLPIALKDAGHELVLDEKVVDKGEVSLDREVPAHGEATVEVSGKATYAKGSEEVQALLEKKSLDIALHGDIAFTRPGGKAEEFVEWGKAGAVRTPRMPQARMYTVQATRSDAQVDLVFLVEVANPNPFDIHLSGLNLKVALNDRPVGEHSTGSDTIHAGGGSQYSVPMTVTPAHFGKDLMQLAKQNRVRYKMAGEIDMGLVKVPVDLAGGVPFSR